MSNQTAGVAATADVASPAGGESSFGPSTGREELASTWPQFSLELLIDPIVLRVPDDSDLAVLADMASTPGCVLPPGREHYVSWLAGYTPLQIRRRFMAAAWRHRDLTARPGWALDLAVVADGRPIGVQSVTGFDRWPDHRVVGTSSWIGVPWQGRGYGLRARAAVLDLTLVTLGAQAAMSWALPANATSVAVTQRLGYEQVGTPDPEDPMSEAKYRLDAAVWAERRPSALPLTRVLDADGLRQILQVD